MANSLVSRAVASLVLAALAGPASAQIPDHLKCYKIRDSLAKTTYAADVNGLAPESGCRIKVPGKLLCVAATKTNILAFGRFASLR